MPCYAANAVNIYFFDENENEWSTNLNQSSYKMSLSNGCATIASQSGVAYSCNGSCKSTGYSTKKDVLPNGSYFIDSSNRTYVCTTNGWVECVPEGSGDLAYALNVRIYNGDMSYDATGYKNYTIKTFGTLKDSTEFCKSPYDHIALWSDPAVWRDLTERSLVKTYTENNRTITEYLYDYCAPGYYLHNYGTTGTTRGTECWSCPTGGISNGERVPTTSWNNLPKCGINCDSGFTPSGDECIEAGIVEEGSCGYGMFNAGYYSGDDRCMYCPHGDIARCDGTRIYCRVDHYLVVDEDYPEESYCAACPSNGDAPVINYYGAYYGWDANKERLYDCVPYGNKSEYDYGYGKSTDCMWHDNYDYYENPSDYCVAFMGTDTTGSFEYRYSDGDWYDCGYSD